MKRFLLLSFLCLFCWGVGGTHLLAQQRGVDVQGRVYGLEGQEPLPYASVYIEQTKSGVVTDVNGAFILHLLPGNYNIEVRYLGYKSLRKTITVNAGSNSPLAFYLPSADYELGEVQVVAKRRKEDPAYPIMRELIARTPVYEHMLQSYSAEVYTKGSVFFHSLPSLMHLAAKADGINLKEFLGKTFVSESHMGITFTAPNNYQKKLYAMRQSFPKRLEETGANSSSMMDIVASNIYSRKIGMGERGAIPSPIREDAFDVYRFKLEKSFTENGVRKHRISFSGKGPMEGGGELIVTEEHWSIEYLFLDVKVQGIMRQVVAGTLNELLPSLYLPTTYNIQTEIKTMGLDMKMSYYSSLSYKDLKINGEILKLKDNTQDLRYGKNTVALEQAQKLSTYLDTLGLELPDKYYVPLTLSKVEKEVDSLFLKRDSSYWNSIVSTPLSKEEMESYAIRDSLLVRFESLQHKKSSDSSRVIEINPSNFEFLSPKISLSSHSSLAFSGLWGLFADYRYTDGLWMGQKVTLNHRFSKAVSLTFSPEAYYTTRRKRVYWSGNLTLLYAPKRRGAWGLSVAHTSRDLAGQYAHSTSPSHSFFATLFDGRGKQLFYDSKHLTLWQKIDLLSGLQLYVAGTFRQSKPLMEARLWGVWKPKQKDWYSWGRTSEETLPAYVMNPHNSWEVEAQINYNPTPYYRYDDNGRKYHLYEGVYSPLISIKYKQAIPTGKLHDSDYILLMGGLSQLIRLNYWYTMSYQLSVGSYIRRKVIHPSDWVYLKADNGATLWGGELERHFLSMPAYSKADFSFAQLHTQWYIPAFLMRLFPKGLLSSANEQIHLNAYWGIESLRAPYLEAGYSIGYGSLLRIGIFGGGYNFYREPGIALRLSFKSPF